MLNCSIAYQLRLIGALCISDIQWWFFTSSSWSNMPSNVIFQVLVDYVTQVHFSMSMFLDLIACKRIKHVSLKYFGGRLNNLVSVSVFSWLVNFFPHLLEHIKTLNLQDLALKLLHDGHNGLHLLTQWFLVSDHVEKIVYVKHGT